MMLQEIGAGSGNAAYNIAKERDWEKIQARLYEEFKILDINNDGAITLDELIQFLR